jgi:hypothetical protein
MTPLPGHIPKTYSPRTVYSLSAYNNNLTAFIPDDISRARQNTVHVPPPTLNPYLSNPDNGRVSHVSQLHKFKLIADPVAHEIEYKRKQVWSVKDIHQFLQSFLEGTKNF